MSNILRVAYANADIGTLRPKDFSLHEQYPLPKVHPDLFGPYEYTFSSDPGLGTTEMFEIPFDLGYVPMAQIMINQASDEYYTPLTEFYLYTCSDLQLFPPFDSVAYTMYVKAEIDDERIRVFLYKEKVGTYSSPVCTGFPNLSGETINFKFYIFREGHADDDVREISVSG